MKFSVRSVGKLFLALTLFISLQAKATEFEYQPAFYHEYDWPEIGKWTGIAALTILGLTQLDSSELAFASVYGFSGVYYIHEKISDSDEFKYEQYVLPLGLATMALVNLTLLKQEDRTKSTIFWMNMLGTGLLGTYWYYFEGPGTKAFTMPWTDGKSVGLAFNMDF